MPDKLTKLDKIFWIDDGAKRGPMTMARVRFHPTAPKVVAQCVDRKLAVWDLNAAPGKEKKGSSNAVTGAWHCEHEAGWIRGFDIDAAGQRIVTGGSDRVLKVWAWDASGSGAPAAKPIAEVKPAHDGWVEAAVFSPDGKHIATVGADRKVKIWNAADLKPLHTLDGHTNYPRDAAFSPDGKWLFTAGEDGIVLVIDAGQFAVAGRIEFGNSNEQQGQNPGLSGALSVSVSRDSSYVAVAGGGGNVMVYEIASLKPVATDKFDSQVALSRAADLIAMGEGTVTLFRYDAGQFKPAVIDEKKKTSTLAKAIPGAKLGEIKRGDFAKGIDFSLDGKLLALGKSDGSVEVWSLT